MKINFWKFLVHLLHDNRGSVSLTGGDAGASAGDGAGDSGLPAGADGGQTAVVDENVDPAGGVADGPAVLSNLSEEIRQDPSLKVFMDDKGNVNYENLVKSYVHAQKKMGEKGVKLPDNHSTDEEWANFYNMVRPSEIDKYELNNSLNEGVSLDEELFTGFRETAHRAGLSQKQAQGILDWFNGVSAESQATISSQKEEGYQKEVEALKADWGEGFQREVGLASRALKEFADEDTVKYLKDSGLDGNVKLIRLFNKIGHGLVEDKFDNESHGTFGVTKEDAQRKMAAIYADQSHAYWDKEHPSHKFAVEEMMKLQEATLR